MADTIVEERIEIPADHESNIFGQYDTFAKKLEKAYRVSLVSRDGILRIIGPAGNVSEAKNALSQLLLLSLRGKTITEQNVNYLIAASMEEENLLILHIVEGGINVSREYVWGNLSMDVEALADMLYGLYPDKYKRHLD